MLSQAQTLTAPDQLVAVTFTQNAVAADQSAVQLPIIEVAAGAGNAVDGYVMPYPGQVLAVSARLSEAASAGSLAVAVSKNGTAFTAPTLAVTTAQSAHGSARVREATYAAGDLIGVEVTTDGDWDATTADLAVTVWALMYVTT